MKHLLIFLLIALFLLMLCSCSGMRDVGSDSKTPPQSSDFEIDRHTVYLLENESNSKSWELDDESERQTFNKVFDDIVITVETNKSKYIIGESIKVRATLQNKTDKNLYLYYANSYLNYPIEFYSDLSLNDKYLLNNRSGFRNCIEEVITVKPNEERSDYLIFHTYCEKQNFSNIYDNEEIAESGVYSGSCWIDVCSEPNYPYGDVTSYSVDFSVTLI